MKIEPASHTQITDVGLRMRERDRREFAAVSEADTRTEIVESLLRRYAMDRSAICASLDGEAVAVGAIVMARPNVGSLCFFATDDFNRVAAGLTKWIRRDLFPRYQQAGVHRIECISIDGYEQTHRWIELLGLKREAVLKGFGKSGETFHQFAWVRE